MRFIGTDCLKIENTKTKNHIVVRDDKENSHFGKGERENSVTSGSENQ